MSSGDPRLDRRYAYARSALEEGATAEAIELLDQTLAERPDWAEAWHLLGAAREKAGERAAAIEAYGQAATLDRSGVLGADLDLARLGERVALDAAPQAYVARLFDEYAPRFERHLRGNLAYRGPEILFEAAIRACGRLPRPVRFARVLDLGCGTGLAGEVFRPHCAELAGVDLSARMIEAARRKHLYDRLTVGGLEDALRREAAGSLDLALAADVFIYLGELGPVFAEAARALGRDGLFAFTVQSQAGEAVTVGADKRFAHPEAYIRQKLAAVGLVPLILEAAEVRQEAGEPAPGLAIVAKRA